MLHWPRLWSSLAPLQSQLKPKRTAESRRMNLPKCRLTGQTGFLIFRLIMIVYYFGQDCTQVCMLPPSRSLRNPVWRFYWLLLGRLRRGMDLAVIRHIDQQALVRQRFRIPGDQLLIILIHRKFEVFVDDSGFRGTNSRFTGLIVSSANFIVPPRKKM